MSFQSLKKEVLQKSYIKSVKEAFMWRLLTYSIVEWPGIRNEKGGRLVKCTFGQTKLDFRSKC